MRDLAYDIVMAVFGVALGYFVLTPFLLGG
jgi:Sec-independent protein secretion pathway component TatC